MFKILLIIFFNKIVNSAVQNDRYRPRYHLAPPTGWMNDPNGFSIFGGNYHLFYQFNPYSSQEPGVAHWGHAVSEDFFHWKHLPIALYPDEVYDKNGVFSGSAVVEGDVHKLIYTGNINLPNSGYIQMQNVASSRDGVNYTKSLRNPVLKGMANQPDFRDPKVWKHGDTWYMVVGNSFNRRGRALLYTSKDMKRWTFGSILAESDGSTGYMWECPDFFELDGKFVLMISPQGMDAVCDNYRNLYQTGYIVGSFDYKTLQFKQESDFKELDRGHDFYATQTLEDNGRRIVVAWFSMWGQNYPERGDGWSGLMTVPRELKLNNGILLQTAVSEFNSIRKSRLFSGEIGAGGRLVLEKSAVIIVENEVEGKLEINLEWKNGSVIIKHMNGYVTINRGGTDGIRRAFWPVKHIQWRILLDSSSIELFCGHGEVVFSSRIFPDGPVNLRVSDDSVNLKVHVISLKQTVPF